jgi:hypothetical protein
MGMSDQPIIHQKYNLRLREVNIPDETLLADLRRVATEFGNGNVTMHLFDKHGKCNSTTLKRRFGSWNEALILAGLPVNNTLNIPDLVLFENLERVWTTLGRQPALLDMDGPTSTVVGSTYRRRFRSWNNALRAFLEYVGNDNKDEVLNVANTRPTHSNRGSRGADLRMRFRVMQRDGFKCRLCGRSPATEQGVVLHIDHVKPWSKGGPTEIENLQTLCLDCNLGKGNLEQ